MINDLRPKAGLYVHIPFCLSKCDYCDFNSIAIKDRRMLGSYAQALKNDAEISGKSVQRYELKSVYFGGGTPSILPQEYIRGFMWKIKRSFSLSQDVEITIEINPATVTKDKLESYRDCGINRASVGVQSFDDKFLKKLGRAHTVEESFLTLELLRKTGFENISIDLMYGLPDQSISSWKKQVEAFVGLGVEHISFYDLVIEKGTRFFKVKDSLRLPEEDAQVKMYHFAKNRLENKGYRHYEISSFARTGRESRHNQIYWKNQEYLGIGAGAYSYLNGCRFSKSREIKKYIANGQAGIFKFERKECLSRKRRLRETMVLQLRLLDGFSLNELEKQCDARVPEDTKICLEQFVSEGSMAREGGNYFLTPKGILIYNSLAEMLV